MKFLVATSTRADWGLLSPLAKALSAADGVEVTVAATNMHLREDMGLTVSEIEAEGFTPLRLPVNGTPSQILSGTIDAFSTLLNEHHYDAVIILGDRYEILGVASAALLAGTPIVHIAGGAVSYGAFDDSVRHAITKMATLHLVETEEYRRRVIRMGENPESVITTGAIGVENLLSFHPIPREDLERDLDFKFSPRSVLVTLHPATLDSLSPVQQMQNLLAALDRVPDLNILISHPNNDTDPAPLISMLGKFESENPGRVRVIPSLGRVRYHSALHYVDAVVGNSSSGLVEVPSAGIPTLDIGIRQDGRTRGPSVVHSDSDAESILAGLECVLSARMKDIASKRENPYYQPDTLDRMTRAILDFEFTPYPQKRFHE